MDNLKSQKVNFRWDVYGAHETLAYLAGIKLRDFFLSPFTCAKCFHLGREKMWKIFGEEVEVEVRVPNISYGHLSCLGVKVSFPEDSAPSVRPVYLSIDEGIQFLKRKINFKNDELFKLYFRMYRYLQKEFPKERVSFAGFGWEGPITSAVLLRGQGFYMDLYDYPEKVKEFLWLLTNSIIKFIHFYRRIIGEVEISPTGASLADDFSSLISPVLWPEFVVPYWEQLYKETTTGSRSVHVEGLDSGHLKYLKNLHISHYDPSVSPKLNPEIIRENIDIPFSWLLVPFEFPRMSKDDVENWVYKSLNDGTAHIFTLIYPLMCENDNPEKVRTFIETAKNIKNRSKP